MFLVIMSNPIMALLSKDVLTGDNFPKWKSNLNIVLVSESIRFILTEDRPPLPAVEQFDAQLHTVYVQLHHAVYVQLLRVTSYSLRPTTASDFIQFTSNYIMNNLTYGLSQLLNELQTFESITRHGKNKGSALYADKSSSPKTKNKLTSGAESSKARPNTSKGKGPAKKERKNFKRSGKGKEKKRENIGKYHHCNTDGHWKSHCPLCCQWCPQEEL